MRIRVALLVVAVLLLAPTAALASLADEQRQGQALVTQLQSRAKTCDGLSGEDFDHIGEYVMGRALGSTTLHQPMNDRMRLMMGDQGEQRMHQVMGQRFAGCTTTASGGVVMGPGMMSNGDGNGVSGSMMNSSDYGWMMNGNWRTMTRQDWQRLQQQWLGTAAATTGHHGWSPWAIIAVALGGVLLAALAALAVIRRPFRRPPAAHSS
jgi:hypothetical protein